MIDLNDVLFLLGLALVCIGAWYVLAWPGVAVVLGGTAMAFGLLRQMPGKG